MLEYFSFRNDGAKQPKIVACFRTKLLAIFCRPLIPQIASDFDDFCAVWKLSVSVFKRPKFRQNPMRSRSRREGTLVWGFGFEGSPASPHYHYVHKSIPRIGLNIYKYFSPFRVAVLNKNSEKVSPRFWENFLRKLFLSKSDIFG